MNQAAGRYVIIGGLIVVVIGIIIYFAGNRINFLGKLPGDIRIDKENFSFRFPIVTCIILSIVITLIIRVVQYFSK